MPLPVPRLIADPEMPLPIPVETMLLPILEPEMLSLTPVLEMVLRIPETGDEPPAAGPDCILLITDPGPIPLLYADDRVPGIDCSAGV